MGDGDEVISPDVVPNNGADEMAGDEVIDDANGEAVAVEMEMGTGM